MLDLTTTPLFTVLIGVSGFYLGLALIALVFVIVHKYRQKRKAQQHVEHTET